jgi:hypothetical protein
MKKKILLQYSQYFDYKLAMQDVWSIISVIRQRIFEYSPKKKHKTEPGTRIHKY